MSIDISHLPATLQRRPEVRALSLRVYTTDDPRLVRVGGESTLHDVYIVGNSYHCDCTAARYGRTCAHVLAAQRAHAQKESPT